MLPSVTWQCAVSCKIEKSYVTSVDVTKYLAFHPSLPWPPYVTHWRPKPLQIQLRFCRHLATTNIRTVVQQKFQHKLANVWQLMYLFLQLSLLYSINIKLFMWICDNYVIHTREANLQAVFSSSHNVDGHFPQLINCKLLV